MPARAARAVRKRGLPAMLTSDELNGGHFVMIRAARIALARGGFPLGDGHV